MGKGQSELIPYSRARDIQVEREKKNKDIKMNEVIKMKYPKCEADKSKQVFCKSVKLPAQ